MAELDALRRDAQSLTIDSDLVGNSLRVLLHSLSIST